MLYFKHAELATQYHVSLRTVHNWIDATKQGKLDLILHTVSDKSYVANNARNIATILQLIESRRKYRNTLHHKALHPNPKFYDIYSKRQILDIITSLNVHNEIPRQYNYMQDGAIHWDDSLKRLAKDKSSNILRSTIDLIQANMPAIDQLLEGNKKVNVIDLGVGNAYPVKGLIGHLRERKLLHRYIGIDISTAMLDVAKKNVKEWYGDTVKFEGYARDITYERFDDLVVNDMLSEDGDETINLVVLFGMTANNFRSFSSVFRVIYGSMGRNDLLMFTSKPDTEASRRYFDFGPSPETGRLSPNHRYILDLLNIDESLYTTEMGYDEAVKMRYIRVRLNSALSIHFEIDNARHSVELEKGDTILLLRVWHQTVAETIDVFAKSGFTLLQSSLTKDHEYFLSIFGIETKSGVKRI